MQSRRIFALMDLKCLTENLKKCKSVVSDRTWEEELDQICIWAKNDGTKSGLPEISMRIEDIKLEVLDRLTFLSLFFVFNPMDLFVFCRNQNLECS